MAILKTHFATIALEPVRLSDYAIGIFPSIPSRKGIKKAIKQGRILVDGQRGETGTWLKTGQRIDLLASEQPLAKVFPLELEVIYEDEYLAVINKPSGFVVSGNAYRTINNALPHNLKPSGQVDVLPYPRAVHRLDGPTSGLLLVAKTAEAVIHLGQQFAERVIRKQYDTIVAGEWPREGEIAKEIAGKHAITKFKVFQTVPSIRSGTLTWLKVFPLTGRRHQIRIHLADQGHAIIGDQEYAPEGKTLRGKGLFLSATALDFQHPVQGEMMHFEITAPSKFAKLMNREYRMWKRYWEVRK